MHQMSTKKQRAKTIGLWVVQVLVALAFLLAGQAKFTSTEIWINQFTGWGYAVWFMYAIGLLEVLGAIGVLIPRLVWYAAVGLTIIMIGALVTHALHDEPLNPLIHLTFLSILLYFRRPAFLRKSPTEDSTETPHA